MKEVIKREKNIFVKLVYFVLYITHKKYYDNLEKMMRETLMEEA